MTNKNSYALLFALASLLSSCKLIGDIFKAGVWTGIFVVVGGIALIGIILFNLFGKK